MPSLEERSALHAALGDATRLAIVDLLWLTDLTPSEVGGRLGLRSNLLAHHLDVLEEAGLIQRLVSAQDRRRRYLRLDRHRLQAPSLGGQVRSDRVLFVCTRNAARSQWAAALWSARTGLAAESAGTQPADRIDPLAVRVARLHQIDLGGTVPKGWDGVSIVPDLVVTVCDRAREIGVSFEAPTLHWSIPDPADSRRVTAYEIAYAAVAERVEQLLDAR